MKTIAAKNMKMTEMTLVAMKMNGQQMSPKNIVLFFYTYINIYIFILNKKQNRKFNFKNIHIKYYSQNHNCKIIRYFIS